ARLECFALHPELTGHLIPEFRGVRLKRLQPRLEAIHRVLLASMSCPLRFVVTAWCTSRTNRGIRKLSRSVVAKRGSAAKHASPARRLHRAAAKLDSPARTSRDSRERCFCVSAGHGSLIALSPRGGPQTSREPEEMMNPREELLELDELALEEEFRLKNL